MKNTFLIATFGSHRGSRSSAYSAAVLSDLCDL